MAQVILTRDLEDRVKNDTSAKVEFTYFEADGVTPIDITGWAFRIQFRYASKIGTVVLDVTDGAGITIVDATNGRFNLDAFLLDWEVGCYRYDIQATKADTVTIRTYVQGKMEVLQDTTTP